MYVCRLHPGRYPLGRELWAETRQFPIAKRRASAPIPEQRNAEVRSDATDGPASITLPPIELMRSVAWYRAPATACANGSKEDGLGNYRVVAPADS